MSLFTRFLDQTPFVLMDGAMATELEVMGASLNDSLWSAKVLIEAPEMIEKVHASYLSAGADLISTASYQATYQGFANRQLSRPQADYLFEESVRRAAAARDQFWQNEQKDEDRLYPLIAASIGPYGAFLADGSEYHGDYGLTREELKAWHRPQVQTMATASAVDLLLFETIPSLEEARAILSLLEEFPGVPYAVSFSCKDERHLSHGESFVEAVDILSEVPQLAAIGINCSAPQFILPLLKSVTGRSRKPIMVYPNSGEVWDAGTHCWRQGDGLPDIPALAQAWWENGARIIGGCCRTTPSQIRTLREIRDSVKSL